LLSGRNRLSMILIRVEDLQVDAVGSSRRESTTSPRRTGRADSAREPALGIRGPASGRSSPTSGGGPSPARPHHTMDSPPGQRRSGPAIQRTADVSGSEDLEPGQPAQGSHHRRRIVTHPESFTSVFAWQRSTNRGDLGAYLSSPAQRRRVGTPPAVPTGWDALRRMTLENEPLLRQMIRFTIDRDPIEPVSRTDPADAWNTSNAPWLPWRAGSISPTSTR
jgi:hypothetical protein